MPRGKIAINGLGRIGRSTIRIILENPDLDLEIVAVNDLTLTKDLAYLFRYDSIMRRFPGEVSHTENALIISNRLAETGAMVALKIAVHA